MKSLFIFDDVYPSTENIKLAILSLIGKYLILIKKFYKEKKRCTENFIF